MSSKYAVRFVAEVVHSNKNNCDYYLLRACLYDGNTLIKKGVPIVWLSKEQYEAYASVQ